MKDMEALEEDIKTLGEKIANPEKLKEDMKAELLNTHGEELDEASFQATYDETVYDMAVTLEAAIEVYSSGKLTEVPKCVYAGLPDTVHAARDEWQWSGVAAVGTTVYAAPYNARYMLRMDTATNAVSNLHLGRWSTQDEFNSQRGMEKWAGIVAVGTRLFCVPYSHDHVLIVQSADGSTTSIEVPQDLQEADDFATTTQYS